MAAAERTGRTAAADRLCESALRSVLPGDTDTAPGIALVAVGGYGRGELAPFSDLDVVLLHEDGVDVRAVAAGVWYPLWDARADVDHAVRALPEVVATARADVRVALGLLDARHLAGDPSLTLRLRSEVLAHWRRDARRQLPELQRLVTARTERVGELAHAAVPDLKEAYGGLRDATVMKALVASWTVDVPHTDLERSRLALLDVRDELHAVTGRPGDRVAPEVWADLGRRLGLADAAAAQRHVREIGRRLTHLSRLTWRRVEAALDRPVTPRRRVPDLRPVGRGVAVSSGEVVLAARTDPGGDPHLLLRAAAEAAERSLVLSPVTAARLARAGVPPPEPWDEEARNLLTRLLAAGPGLLEVWETLEETGALDALLPEWQRVRLLPHASVVHRFTVDRHLVETCMEAARLIRRVGRPDVLMAAALLHDLGKGTGQDHSVAGEPLAGAAAARLGFDEREQALVRRLVRHHLLLAETATTRDLEDPATVALVVERLGDVETLDLLAALTEADARATSAKAWTGWRARLVDDLVRRSRAVLEGRTPAAGGARVGPPAVPDGARTALRADPAAVHVAVERTGHGATLTMSAHDRVGLIADTAAVLALLRVGIRSARAWVEEDLAVSTWEVAEPSIDPAMVRQRLEAVRSGRLDPRSRLRPPADRLPPSVLLRPDASAGAAVIEVRMEDRPGVVYVVCRALADLGLSVGSAHVSTLGPQAVDVFYVREPGGEAPSAARAGAAVHAIEAALSATATLDA
ncbi:[protein-PII] uridylyltransferase [Nocardioides mesophilus]|uniref:Bifunctional uridylyltransferase/uridylyl-removing enzyme n=1 Tax=Nocardioides mesophilus TaxID=433659 RepID=A0A7G9R952_9ACTN|nr:[protein-PII] uridylyltransferase [Nocardioides mesophilus]QNN52127.1 [protein-PII] uridylyltransferase [Nocardioides mesophilus]